MGMPTPMLSCVTTMRPWLGYLAAALQATQNACLLSDCCNIQATMLWHLHPEPCAYWAKPAGVAGLVTRILSKAYWMQTVVQMPETGASSTLKKCR